MKHFKVCLAILSLLSCLPVIGCSGGQGSAPAAPAPTAPTPTAPTPTPTPTPSFTITVPATITATVLSQVSLPVTVTSSNGSDFGGTICLEGTPSGVTVTPQSCLTFSSTSNPEHGSFVLSVALPTLGSYPLTLITESSVYLPNQTVTLVITNPTAPAPPTPPAPVTPIPVPTGWPVINSPTNPGYTLSVAPSGGMSGWTSVVNGSVNNSPGGVIPAGAPILNGAATVTAVLNPDGSPVFEGYVYGTFVDLPAGIICDCGHNWYSAAGPQNVQMVGIMQGTPYDVPAGEIPLFLSMSLPFGLAAISAVPGDYQVTFVTTTVSPDITDPVWLGGSGIAGNDYPPAYSGPALTASQTFTITVLSPTSAMWRKGVDR
jgi:hypothetical protein